MDYEEEQQQEVAILQSIYPDEMTVKSPTEFEISILLETNSERKHTVTLGIQYPETYPEVEPEIDVTGYSEEDEDEDESDDNEESKVVIIAEFVELSKQDLSDLRNALVEEAADNVGMPCVFTLASSLKDRAEELFERKVKAEQKSHDDKMLAREREEQKKFYGTKVTPETFQEWRAKFRKELRIDERIEERKRAIHNNKMTGKEIFEAGLAGDEDITDVQT